MECPQCHDKTFVLDSRSGKDLVRRRRVCHGCSYRFTTYELSAERVGQEVHFTAKISVKAGRLTIRAGQVPDEESADDDD